MNPNDKLIFVGEDIGGLNALEPLILKLNGKLISGIHSDKEIKKAVQNADIIVAGTSMSTDSLDKKFVRMAKQLGKKSVMILDSWVNYDIRFKNAIPDYIFVMDDLAKAEMLIAGFPEEKLIVTGNPYFDQFKKNSKDSESGESIIFFCQPFTELENSLGLNEVEILKDFVEVFKNININKKIKVKIHPRTKKFCKFDTLDVEITHKSVGDLINESSLVIGMNSMALFEATMRGKKVLSYQPGLNVPDPLVTNRMGITKGVYKKMDLEKTVLELLNNNLVVNNYKLMENATEKVINTLKNLP